MPAQYLSDEIGENADTVYIKLGGEKILISKDWMHTESILSQPCSWHIAMGWGDVSKDLIQRYPKRTPFGLYVGETQQASGYTDSIEASQPDGGPWTVTVAGRDALAPLHDSYVAGAVGVNVSTYAQLVWFALQQVGLAPKFSAFDPNNQTILKVGNDANRQIKTGVPLGSILPHRTADQILAAAAADGNDPHAKSAGSIRTLPQAKLNETWHKFCRRHLDRAGLMLWAAADGTFVLGSPNGNQTPIYKLSRPLVGPNTGSNSMGANIIGTSFKDDGTHRHTEAVIYGRGGGKKLGRAKQKGLFLDEDLLDAGYPSSQKIVFRDVHANTSAEAIYFARRKIAEERRSGWRLEYTISGLTLPYAPTGGVNRAVVCPDTVIAVDDKEVGLQGNFYVDTVIRRRSPQTTTTIRLVRPEDLVFGGPDADQD